MKKWKTPEEGNASKREGERESIHPLSLSSF